LKEELLELTRQLRRRLELGHETDFRAGASAAGRAGVPSKAELLSALAKSVESCRACPLGSQRLKPVFGVGSADAEVIFVGEGPGFEEDHRGEPFVGKSGQLLDRILESIGLSRPAVYIANIVKCHPMKDPSDPEARANDRPPTPEEIAACRSYLDEQIRRIGPRVIVTLGSVPTRVLLGTSESITGIRGQWRQYTPAGAERPIPLLPTFHPAALLRDPDLKKDVWTDMKNLRAALARFPETP
jgi:uracil-DNA glycosylase